MSECPFCGQGMLEADSCSKSLIAYPAPSDEGIDGVYRLAIPHGEEDQWDAVDGDCHDCGVSPGGHHHPGCDIEESPLTGGQLLREVIDRPPERAPLHVRAEPDPHEHISLEDVHQGGDER